MKRLFAFLLFVLLTLTVTMGLSEEEKRLEIQERVEKAARLIEENGPEIFSLFYDRDGEFFIGEEYIFIYDDSGTNLVNAGNPTVFEGRNLISLKDKNGLYMIVRIFEVALNQGGGWLDFYWPLPDGGPATFKSAYVMSATHGELTYVLGMGYYKQEQ
ncbi:MULTISPECIES: cache domain-containing protein [unclassified Mesotoga]|uniref:cache domain-containing protein n=1 Tax=unclassified Mesotoga TaxID=1184398 RepID=UPI000EF1F865|nr:MULTISPECIES: cache domain-containing protein [unclassified Mesotoga]MDI9367513.1 cache domain-containing protein [Thermotogota bacterium]NLT44944.1 hypothetical protein [Thermotogaceae bacterium]MDD3681217.1 cache domain-containing protein [Mesotoga sp.]MDD4208000.1 cache domain-containing protein [Mesotoga sp.]MDD4825139.1 cache domain-containing protein [Mesotoga sp.]